MFLFGLGQTMAKVIAAVVKFSKEQTDDVMQHEERKTSLVSVKSSEVAFRLIRLSSMTAGPPAMG